MIRTFTISDQCGTGCGEATSVCRNGEASSGRSCYRGSRKTDEGGRVKSNGGAREDVNVEGKIEYAEKKKQKA